MAQVDNKRVAKNAIALTLRMILATIVGLYTSRIVLQALGVDDYGIYGVIGGVVGMAAFLNSSMAGATSRFLTFELGTGNSEKMQKIFSTALMIHLGIAVVVAVLAETVGLWFVNNKMNFPADSMTAVNVLYQFTIISMMVSFTQVPYTAAIIAHERMNIYAYFEIVNVALKLLIVYLLLLFDDNRLIYYAAMMLGVSVLSASIYRIYCIRHFKESHFKFGWDKSIIKSMLTFSGFDLYGNMCATAKKQGQPILLNLFFGVLANAGASIALTVSGAISGLTTSIAQAFRPQIIKQYSASDIYQMVMIMRRSAQFTLMAYAIVALPIMAEAHNLLYLWLGQVPQYSVEFLRLIIITAFFGIIINVNNAAIHATGNIKNISFFSGTFYLLSPVISYFVLKFMFDVAIVVYIVDIVCLSIVTFMGFYFIHLQIRQLPLRRYFFPVLKSWGAIAVSLVAIKMMKPAIETIISPDSIVDKLILLVVVGLVGMIIIVALNMAFVLNKSERDFLMAFVRRKLRISYKCI